MIHVKENSKIAQRTNLFLDGVKQTLAIEFKVPEIVSNKEMQGEVLEIQIRTDGGVVKAKDRPLLQDEIVKNGIICRWVKGKVKLDIK